MTSTISPAQLRNSFQLGVTCGTFTIVNVATGGHRTIRIRQQKEDAPFAPGQQIIALLGGPQSDHRYLKFGFVTPGGVKVWPSRSTNEELTTLAVWMSTSLIRQLREGVVTIEGAARCRRCNRKLTHPDSLQDGYGPECRKKL